MSVITDQIGYLEYDYLTEPYLMGFITSGQGIQFQVKNNKTEANALQFLYQIIKQSFVGKQWQSLIKKQEPQALQFQAAIENVLASVAFQSANKITVAQSEGVQAQALIKKLESVGVQFQAAIQDVLLSVGLQIEAKDYDTLSEGVQFQAQINEVEKIGAQFLSQIFALSPAGVQFQSSASKTYDAALQVQNLINDQFAAGAQFDAQNVTLIEVGAQFEGFISVADNVALQAQGQIFTQAPAGLQALGKRYETGAQGLQFQGAIEAENNLGVELIAAKGWPHFQCGPGYLEEFGYCEEWPYLAPRICVKGGVQFEVINQQTKRIGVQFEGKINVTQPIALQAQGKIYEQLMVGVQFAGRRYETHVMGMQAQGKIYEQDSVGAQAQGKIYETFASGFQFEAIDVESIGLQVRVAIYNTTNLRILCEFPSRGTTGTNWVADSTATSSTSAFSVNNLNTDIVEQVWRSAPGSAATLVCDTESPSGVFVDTVAILNHNLSGGATVQLQYSDDNISWGVYANMLVEKENMYYIAPSLPLTPHRYWRFIINDTGSSYIQIGTIVFGSAIIFQGECFVDSVKFGKKQFKDEVFTEGHTNISNDRGKKRFVELDFQDLNYGKANFKQLRQVFGDAGTILKCLWIPTPQTVSRFAVFGKLDTIPEETHNTRGDDYVSLGVRVDEAL